MCKSTPPPHNLYAIYLENMWYIYIGDEKVSMKRDYWTEEHSFL